MVASNLPEPVGSSAGGSGLISAGLGTCQSVKSKCVNTVYLHNASYKKPKKPVTSNVIDLSVGLLSVENIGGTGVKSGVFWGSKIGSIVDSVSNLLDVENMVNTVAKETSYVESGEDNNIDNDMPKKTHTRMYMLDNPLKQLFLKLASQLMIFLVWCAVICFEDETSKLAAIGSVLVFKNVSLYWASFSLVCCTKCKQFGHISDVYLQASIARPVSFGEKIWAQIAGSSSLHVVSLAAPSVGSVSGVNSLPLASISLVVSKLNNYLASLECSLKILSDQISGILRKLSFIKLVLLTSPSCASSLAVFVPVAPILNSNMALDDMLALSSFPLPNVGELVVGFSSSSSKILTSKVGGLESKMLALEVSVGSVLAKLNLLCSDLVWKVTTCNIRDMINLEKQKNIVRWHLESSNMVSFFTKTKLRVSAGSWIKNKFESVRIFTSGLEEGFLGMGVAVVIDGFLAQHVSKVKEVLGQVISVCLLFKNKLSVTFLDLYAGVSAKTCFAQALSVNSLISKGVNCSSFVVIGRDFNENSARRCASFRKCLDLGLVNSLSGHPLDKSSTWRNSWGVEKTIDYVFVSEVLSSAVVGCSVASVSEFFDTNHNMVGILVGLGGLVDAHLNGIYKQTNKDHWKYKIKDIDTTKWDCFRDRFSVRLSELSDTFLKVLRNAVCNLTDKTFSKYWFCEFDGPKNKQSSKFFKLKFLVAKITKSLCSDRLVEVECFVWAWSVLDVVNASEFATLLENSLKLNELCSLLSKVKKCYRKSKYYEAELARCKHIKDVIDKHIENFNSNKGEIIRSVLEYLFCKVVLDHLVVDDELILDPMERIFLALFGLWAHQYASLNHVNNNVFSGVMSNISLNELSLVICGLSNNKAAGLSGITNELPIVLIEMIRKILSKILSDQISLVYSEFDIFCGDNFSVLRGTLIQSPVFVIGLIVENALEKGWEIWLVLQNIRKAYDSVGWHYLRSSLKCIKMCSRFIEFFGNIYENRINRIMTDFGLSNSYIVHNSLDQSEVFSLLLWRIFYDPFLCEVKRQEYLCSYRINSSFVVKSGRVKSNGDMLSFFAAGAFVDDMIWVGNNQTLTQYILDIASEFFDINDISINNDKTVAILINQKMKDASLYISNQPISIAKKCKSHRYLSIFLSTKGFLKPSLAKAHTDVKFFSNLVFRKVVLDKQFSYLVLAVLQPIIYYHMQFSFVAKSVCQKWNIMIRKGLRAKVFLPKDFPSKVLYHLFLYGLKPFEQVQAEAKVVLVIGFSNALGIFGHMFEHCALDLQVLSWTPLNPLCHLVKLRVCLLNNFLAGVVRIFLNTGVFLDNKLFCAFRKSGHFPMSDILNALCYFDVVHSLKHFGIVFAGSNHGLEDFLLLEEADKTSVYMYSSLVDSNNSEVLNSSGFFCLSDFLVVCECLHEVWAGELNIFIDGLLSGLDTLDVACGAAVYFSEIDMGVSVRVQGLLSSTLAELQAIAVALECVLSSCSVIIHSNSQATLDACHIANLIKSKDVIVSLFLLVEIHDRFFVADGLVVSGNAQHFIHNVCRTVCHVLWEAGLGANVLFSSFLYCIDWECTASVWHLDSHMLADFTSRKLAALHTYLIKAVHSRLPVAVCKRLYNIGYPSVLCLMCGNIKFFDHKSLVGVHLLASFSVLNILANALDVSIYAVLCKSFVFRDWIGKTVSIFGNGKKAWLIVVKFVCYLVDDHCDYLWLLRSKFRVGIEKVGLVCNDGLPRLLSDNVVYMLGMVEFFAVSFGSRKHCLFFSSLDDGKRVLVSI
ncbi:hypothetical protein G9A89_022899 [Geosiphon pyriformis]|nr:hypothetical protein G9A89_022899 [Geosiphon pyriformis]